MPRARTLLAKPTAAQIESIIEDVLRRAGVQLSKDQSAHLARKINLAISNYLHDLGGQTTDREIHDALRKILQLADSEDPQIGLLRGRLSRLPSKVKTMIQTRADLCFRRDLPESGYAGDIDDWFRKASKDDLIKGIYVTIPDGSKWVREPNRGQKQSKRYSSRLEPTIRGIARGADAGAPKKGRPTNWVERDLALRLVGIWERVTGTFPEFGRSGSEHTLLGDLVHSIFQLLRLPSGTATSSLRAAQKALKTAHEPERG